MNTDPPIIEISNLTRRYGKTDAVDGLSLKVQAGKCYGPIPAWRASSASTRVRTKSP
ncbi:MAG TPA: hypothetical protein VNN22_10995 [Verrucomicrobiae bacterium]|nr:hypothetical protein [Verrucomicrobiae bacterium]